MAGIEIPCPKCGTVLKLPDRRLLGRKGKCSQCAHKFILEEPHEIATQLELPNRSSRAREDDESDLEMASESAYSRSDDDSDLELAAFPNKPAASGPSDDSTMMGMDAKWITPASVPAPQPPAPQPAASRPAPPAPTAFPSPGRPAAAAQMRFPTASTAPSAPPPSAPIPAPSPSFAAPEVHIPAVEEESGGVARLKALKKKKSKGKKFAIIGTVATVLVAAGVYFSIAGNGTTKKTAKNAKSQKTTVATTAKSGNSSSDTSKLPTATAKSPTKGKPIDLLLVPAGARVVINLRPAELWKTGDDSAAEEFRACLGPLGVWTGEMIKTHCFLDPTAIEELLICVLAASPGVAPELAMVVHTKDDVRKSVLLEKFNGELIDEPRPHYVGPEKAYIIFDPRTFAIAPAKLAQEMVQAADNPSLTADGILELLGKTDRKRHVTVVFEPVSVRISAPFLGPDNAQPLLNGLLDWVGEEVEAAAWSMHLGDEHFYSELLLRNQVGSPQRLQRTLVKQLDTTPRDILAIVEKMNPQETGKRKLIGRFPAMSKVYALMTHIATGERLVSLTTSLPERAAPNLALGALLAWDQTTRPEYGKGSKPTGPTPTQQKLPDLLVDRLKTKISVDFRNEPLYQAIGFVGEETGINFKIEGNDLKMVGVTQNMKQQFKMDNAPATAVLFEILDKIQLVIVVDEEKKLITVTSAKVAEEKKLAAYPLAKGK